MALNEFLAGRPEQPFTVGRTKHRYYGCPMIGFGRAMQLEFQLFTIKRVMEDSSEPILLK